MSLQSQSASRINFLNDLGLLWSQEEQSFDELTSLAALICQTPVSLITFFDQDKQFFKSHHGLDLCETPLEQAFCTHAAENGREVFIIEDARNDPRFVANPLVTGDPGVVFYAGFPLYYQDSIALGGFCVIDFKPRQLSDQQVQALKTLGNQVLHLISLRAVMNQNDQTFRLLKSEQQFSKEMLSTIEGVFWTADPQTFQFKFISPQVERIFGYSPAEWLGSPTFWQDHIHPEDRDAAVNLCTQETFLLRDHQFQYRLRKKSGEYIWVQDRVVVKSNYGVPHLIQGFIWDINSEKLFEKELRQESKLNKAIRNDLPGLFFLFDKKGKVRLCNQLFLKVTGLTRKELKGKSLESFLTTSEGKSVDIAHLKDCADKNREIEVHFLTESKEQLPILLRVSKIRYKGKVYLMGLALDLSNIKKVERELALSHEKFKALVQDGGDMVGVVDFHGVYQYVSPTYKNILGIDPEDYLGKVVFDFIHTEDLDLAMSQFQSLAEQKRVSVSPFRFKDKDGKWRWIETIATNLMEDPAIGGIVINSRDVTDQIIAKQLLEASESRYKIFFDSQTNYLIRTDMQGNYTFANKKFLEHFGWIQEGEVIGKNCMESICNYHHTRVREVVELCVAAPGQVMKVELDKPGKIPDTVMTTLWDFVCLVDSNGLPSEIQCSGIDITESIYFERELRRSNERFELVNQANSEYIYEFNPLTHDLYLGEKFEDLLGVKRKKDSENYEFIESLRAPEDNEIIRKDFEDFVYHTTDTFWTQVYKIQKNNGEYLWIRDNAVILRTNQGKPLRVIGSVRDITESHYFQKIDAIERGLADYIVGGQSSFEEVLYEYLIKLEELFPEMQASIMIRKGEILLPVAAPSLHPEYVQALHHGIPIGPNQGSCGSAAHSGQPVIVTNVQEDERWKYFKELGEKFGFSACWSIPIFNNQGWVVGTFACYYKTVRPPFKNELYAIERAQRLLNLHFTQNNYLESLKRNLELFELINHATKDAIYDWDLITDELVFGESFTLNFGHPIDLKKTFSISEWEDLLHPEDQARTVEDLKSFLGDYRKERWENEYRLRKYNGSFANVEEIGLVIRDKIGRPIRMVGVLRNITEYKNIQLLVDESNRIAKLGGWELDLIAKSLTWTNTVYDIHEIPYTYSPDLEDAVLFYRPDFRKSIRDAIAETISNQQDIDQEAILVTSRGIEKWVRVKGKGEFFAGECVKISGSIQDIHSVKLKELEIQYQNNLFKSITEVIGFLFKEDNWADVCDAAFKLIGEVVNVDRIYLFENSQHPISGEKFTSQKFEWVNLGVKPEIDNPELQNVPLEVFTDLFKCLESNQPFMGIVSQMEDENLKGILEMQGIKSILIFPLFVENIFWGFVGFDDCTRDRRWKQSEINFLKTFTSNLDSAIKRRKDKASLEALLNEKNSILESVGDGFFVINKLGQINYWNKAAESLIGIKRERLIGKVFLDEVPEAAKLPFFNEYLDLINRNEIYHVEEFYPLLNKWFELSAYPSGDSLSVFFRDITDRKSYEEAILQSNERFEIIAKATQDIIWDFDILNNQLYVSEGISERLGFTLSDEFDSFEHFLDLIHEEDREVVRQEFYDYVSGINRDSNWEIDYRLIRKNNSLAYIQHKTFFLRDRKGRAIRALGAMVDITTRKSYEESLKLLNQELEKRVKELANSNLELEQFAYVTSHDLQEPLRMITSFLSLLEIKYGSLLDDKAKNYIGFAVDGARRMRQLILDLLEYSRSGKIYASAENIDLNNLLGEISSLIKKKIAEKNARITFNNLPTLKVFKAPLQQVLLNLIENGIKYSYPDRSPILEISAYENQSEWVISVADNGIGINEEYFDKIFVIFQRLHRKEDYKGTGIGLSIVKKQVESWEGRIWLESMEGVGSTFFFTIPK